MAADDAFPLVEAQIISTWMGSVTFGIMLVSFFICIRTLLTSDSALNPISFRVLLAVSILMAILDGADKSLQLRHMLDAFIYYTGPGGPKELFENTKNWVNFSKTAVYVVQTWLGDGVLVYRCIIVYDKRWYGVIPPLILFVSSLTMGSFMISFTDLQGRGTITGTKLKPIILSFLTLSLAQNVVITTAIALKIFVMQRRMAGSLTSATALSRIRRAVIIIVESGALYSGSMIILVGSFVTNNVTDYAWSGVASSVIPIAFNLIIIRVHQGLAIDQRQLEVTREKVDLSACKFKSYPTGDGRKADPHLRALESGTETEIGLGTESYLVSPSVLLTKRSAMSEGSGTATSDVGGAEGGENDQFRFGSAI